MVFTQDILQFFLSLLKLYFKFMCLITVSAFLSVFMHVHTRMHTSTSASFLTLAALFSSDSTWGSGRVNLSAGWPTHALVWGGKIPSNHICHLLHLPNAQGSALNLYTEEIKLPVLRIEVISARFCINLFSKHCCWLLGVEEEASVYPRVIM